MATPLGHSIVGYTLARAAGVRSSKGLALAVGAANLPDVDFLLGFVANGDLLSLHREVITHRPVFPLLAAAVAGAASGVVAVASGRVPTPGRVLRPAALAAALVGSHIAMDPLPLPYEGMASYHDRFWQVVATHSWNAVIDMAVYGALAMLVLSRNGSNGHAPAAAN